MPRFAYFGTPYVARDTLAALLDAGFTPALVITSPDAPRGRGLAIVHALAAPRPREAWALESGVRGRSPTRYAVLDQMDRVFALAPPQSVISRAVG